MLALSENSAERSIALKNTHIYIYFCILSISSVVDMADIGGFLSMYFSRPGDRERRWVRVSPHY